MPDFMKDVWTANDRAEEFFERLIRFVVKKTVDEINILRTEINTLNGNSALPMRTYEQIKDAIRQDMEL